MDAITLLKTQKMICDHYTSCGDCLFYENYYCQVDTDKDYEEYVETIENWLKQHPPKTRQDVFLEQFPNSKLDTGTLFLAPCYLDDTLLGLDCNSFCDRVKKYGSCFNCKVEYWNEEVE
ncbi:hypothetical protein M2140_001940 [Clostridiales Family XIII bacterium PM5-7]